jgi:hypothetical protein
MPSSAVQTPADFCSFAFLFSAPASLTAIVDNSVAGIAALMLSPKAVENPLQLANALNLTHQI